jgi:hypothetical protein
MMEGALLLSVTTRIQEHDHCLTENIQNPSDTGNNINLHEIHNGDIYNCYAKIYVAKR